MWKIFLGKKTFWKDYKIVLPVLFLILFIFLNTYLLTIFHRIDMLKMDNYLEKKFSTYKNLRQFSSQFDKILNSLDLEGENSASLSVLKKNIKILINEYNAYYKDFLNFEGLKELLNRYLSLYESLLDIKRKEKEKFLERKALVEKIQKILNDLLNLLVELKGYLKIYVIKHKKNISPEGLFYHIKSVNLIWNLNYEFVSLQRYLTNLVSSEDLEELTILKEIQINPILKSIDINLKDFILINRNFFSQKNLKLKVVFQQLVLLENSFFGKEGLYNLQKDYIILKAEEKNLKLALWSNYIALLNLRKELQKIKDKKFMEAINTLHEEFKSHAKRVKNLGLLINFLSLWIFFFIVYLIHKEIQKRLKTEASFKVIKKIVDTFPGGILLIEYDTLKIKLINKTALKFLGIDKEPVEKFCINFCERAENCINLIKKLEKEGTLFFESQLRKPEGTVYLLKVLTLTTFGDKKYIIEGFIDITPQIKALKDLEKLNELKSVFVSTVVHELRTPLTAFIGTLELIKSKEDFDKFLPYLKNSAEYLQEIVNSVLDYFKIESGMIKINIEEFDVYKEAEKLLSLYVPLAYKKKIFIKSLIKADLVKFRGDKNKILEILANLVKNGIKFTNKGGVYVKILLKDCDALKCKMIIEVQDTGPGIPEEYIEKIFEPFFQVPSHKKITFEGTGLGLAICKRLVEVLGGTIKAESPENGGAKFVVEIPLEKTDKPLEIKPPELKEIKFFIYFEDPFDRDIWESYFNLTEAECYFFKDFDNFKEMFDKEDSSKIVIFVPLEKKEKAEKIVDVKKFKLVTYGFLNEDKNGISFPLKIREFFKFLEKLKDELEKRPFSEEEKGLKTEKEKKFPFKILLAEDDLINQGIIKKLFETFGCKVDVVSNGREVIEKLKEKDYDLIVMDCNMPELGGIETTKIIRKTIRKEIPIVALTAFATEEEKEKCLSVGMNFFVEKPVNKKKIEELLEKVENYLLGYKRL